MRSTDWPVQVGFTLLSYVAFAYLIPIRWVVLTLLPFAFGYYIARDEYRIGRAVILSALPVLMGIVILFLLAFFSLALSGSGMNANGILGPAAASFLILLVLGTLLGFPLAYAGYRLRRPSIPPAPSIPQSA